MQRIICRYRRDEGASAWNHAEVRERFQRAAELAGLPVNEDRRGIVMGPPLPTGATSEDERLVFELTEPRDPAEVRLQVNLHLPSGLFVERAWIARHGSPDQNPAQCDEAVYDLTWHNAPPAQEVIGRLRAFLASTDVPFTRVREKKTQQLNARALVRAIQFYPGRDAGLRLQVTLVMGAQGTLRPEEVLPALGYAPVPDDDLRVHRVAVRQAAWRTTSRPQASMRWRRDLED